MRALLLLALAACPAPPARALEPVADARPQLAASGLPLDWWDGGPAFLLASARAVRLNLRGVFPVRSGLRDDLALAGWASAPCNESTRALCSSDFGDAFPAGPARAPDRPWALADGWRSLGCARSDGKVLVREEVYDLTACDVWDEGVDLVFARGMLYFRRTEPPFWEYCALVALCVVLVRCLCFNVQVLLQPGTPVASQLPGLLAACALLALVGRDADAAYVTRRDRLFFWASFGFAGLYLAVYAAESSVRGLRREQAGPMFNLLVAGLQLAAMRFYRTSDTPYTLLLLPMLAARLWAKVLLRADGSPRPDEGPPLPELAPWGEAHPDWHGHARHARPAPHPPRPDTPPGRALSWTHHVTALLDALFLSLYNWVAVDAQGLLLVPAYAGAFVVCELLHGAGYS